MESRHGKILEFRFRNFVQTLDIEILIFSKFDYLNAQLSLFNVFALDRGWCGTENISFI